MLRLHKPGRLALTAFVGAIFAAQDVTDWTGCFVVASESKMRVLRKT